MATEVVLEGREPTRESVLAYRGAVMADVHRLHEAGFLPGPEAKSLLLESVGAFRAEDFKLAARKLGSFRGSLFWQVREFVRDVIRDVDFKLWETFFPEVREIRDQAEELNLKDPLAAMELAQRAQARVNLATAPELTAAAQRAQVRLTELKKKVGCI